MRGLRKLIEELSVERKFKDFNGKEVSSFFKILSDSQLNYLANNLNESVYNFRRRFHQGIIAYSCFVSAPIAIGSDYKFVLATRRCNFDKKLDTYVRHAGDVLIEMDKENKGVLRNLAKACNVKLTKEQKSQIRVITDCGDELMSLVYRDIIVPMFNYKK